MLYIYKKIKSALKYMGCMLLTQNGKATKKEHKKNSLSQQHILSIFFSWIRKQKEIINDSEGNYTPRQRTYTKGAKKSVF